MPAISTTRVNSPAPAAARVAGHAAAPTGQAPSAAGVRSWRAATRGIAPGLAVALGIALIASLAGSLVPVIGGPVFGIVLGVVVAGLTARWPGSDAVERLRPGSTVASRHVLQASIVLLGATLSLRQVARVGLASLPVMLGTLVIALAGAWVLGRWFGVRGDTQLLIGVGTAICGASAIAATQAVVKARDSEVAYAIATIFTCNITAVLLFPQLGHLLDLDPHAFGLWAGTAVNDTSSVVAAGYTYGGDAGPYSVVVKLTRSLMLIPIVLALGLWAARRDGAPAPDASATGSARTGHRRRDVPWTRLVPLFLVGFVVASALESVGVVPASWHGGLTVAGTFLITTALAGIGLSMRPRDIRRAGPRPLLLGVVLWVAVAAGSLALQAVTGTL